MWESLEPSNAYLAAQEYVDRLYNEFILRRLLCRVFLHDPSELLQVAYKIMTVVVEVSNIRGPLVANSSYIPWIMVFYGMPCAGVLAFELLRRKKSVSTAARDISWPQVVQDLSVFIASLKYVHAAGDGNYELTQKAYKTLQQIMLRILSGCEFPVQDNSIPPLLKPMDIPNEVMESIAWLDNSSFDADFWICPPDLPLLS